MFAKLSTEWLTVKPQRSGPSTYRFESETREIRHNRKKGRKNTWLDDEKKKPRVLIFLQPEEFSGGPTAVPKSGITETIGYFKVIAVVAEARALEIPKHLSGITPPVSQCPR